jgi:pimeloyl-ACP methyl ester carboxylesterase
MAQIPIVKNVFTYITPRFIVKSSVENVYADKTKVTDSLVDRYFELSLRAGNRQAFIDRLDRKETSIGPRSILLIEQRTLVLWGEQDQLIPVEKAYQFHDDLPNDTLVILKNVGHVPMEESPDESLKPVSVFLQN